jgi:NAD(P)-dependent dehydrogenase (short-subunit alcohol dehydrogenase family)
MATWMVSKGAKNIVLLSRSGELKGKAKDQIDALNAAGAAIVARRCDVADRSDVEQLIATGLNDFPPVRGLVHGAMVLHDVLFEKMTHHQYKTVIESKVKGARNFYDVLSAVNAPLDFFVCISSAAGAVGNRGQAASSTDLHNNSEPGASMRHQSISPLSQMLGTSPKMPKKPLKWRGIWEAIPSAKLRS